MATLTTLLYGVIASLYTLAAVAHLFHMFRRGFDGLARWSTRSAWALQSAGLLLQVVQSGRAPFYTFFEFSYFFTWLLMTNYIAIEMLRQNQSGGSFLTPVIAGVLILSTALADQSPNWSPDRFPAGLIVWHVCVIMMGYAFFVASFVSGALYLIQERNLRQKRWGPLYHRLPALEALDLWGARFVYVGFPLLTIGMLAGIGFAHLSWQAFWQADPKVIFTLFVWLVYGGYLLLRKAWGWGGRRAAWWSIAGVAAVLINYFLINYLSHLHRFGV